MSKSEWGYFRSPYAKLAKDQESFHKPNCAAANQKSLMQAREDRPPERKGQRPSIPKKDAALSSKFRQSAEEKKRGQEPKSPKKKLRYAASETKVTERGKPVQ
ncbi:MAG: hypothetical protein P4M08_07965 [Oligoflexia bacterium]|nr:hypothetical protein [Oligoflexia bacterium]